MTHKPLVQVEHLSKSYHLSGEKIPILHDVSLTVSPGEWVAILGTSGSGKSTLMHVLGLLDSPDSGSYWLHQHPTETWSDDEKAYQRNRYIGFVFQQFYLLPRLSALQNVALPLQYQDVPRNSQHERAMHALEQVGLADRAHHKPTQMSGGQQQRVAIARALICNPSLLLADEPTGALDSHTGEAILALFSRLASTVVMVTHDTRIADYCHRQIHLVDGRIVDEKTCR